MGLWWVVHFSWVCSSSPTLTSRPYPVSATACVLGIIGRLGYEQLVCITRAVMSFIWLKFFRHHPFYQLWWGYKAGFETNDLKYLNPNCSAPHRHMFGNCDLCIALVHVSYPATIYCPELARSYPSWWLACLQGVGHVLDLWPSSTSKLQEKQTFQLAYLLTMLEYCGAALRARLPITE